MGHSIFNRYKMKLNKSLPSYDGLLTSITDYLRKCHAIDEKDRGESYAASLQDASGELVISFYSYKSHAPVSLSSDLLNLVKNNINTDPSRYYYYLEEEGHENNDWYVRSVYGKSHIVASNCRTWNSSGLTDSDDLKKFHDSLYADAVTSVHLNDTSSIIKLIEILEFKGRALSYFDKDINRILIPLWRSPSDGFLWLAGYDYKENKLTLYTMKVSLYGENKKMHHISEYHMHDVTFEDFIFARQKTIAKNLEHQKLVAVAIKRHGSTNNYGQVDQHAHFRKNVDLFDENGPVIEVKNKIV